MEVHLLVVRLDGFLHRLQFFGSGFGAFGGGVFVLVGMLHLRFLPGLNRLRRARGGIFTVVFLFLKDFLVVGNITWIGHRPQNRGGCRWQPCGSANDANEWRQPRSDLSGWRLTSN